MGQSFNFVYLSGEGKNEKDEDANLGTTPSRDEQENNKNKLPTIATNIFNYKILTAGYQFYTTV